MAVRSFIIRSRLIPGSNKPGQTYPIENAKRQDKSVLRIETLVLRVGDGAVTLRGARSYSVYNYTTKATTAIATTCYLQMG